MKVSIEKEELVIRLPLNQPPVLSSTGKTLVVASTCGNQRTDAVIDDQNVIVGVNAYIARPARSAPHIHPHPSTSPTTPFHHTRSTGGTARMSHIVSIQTKVRDPAAITAACQRLGLAAPFQGTTELFSGEATGLLVQLPGWQYPVVIDVTTGELRYDNYNGAWGAQEQLDRFLQLYAVEKVIREAQLKNYAVSEQTLQDGSVQLRITQGG